jgi:RNA polymerase subunit RPABC4/transcription elongation factor Spt4
MEVKMCKKENCSNLVHAPEELCPECLQEQVEYPVDFTEVIQNKKGE